jgi:hypothetical protein
LSSANSHPTFSSACVRGSYVTTAPVGPSNVNVMSAKRSVVVCAGSPQFSKSSTSAGEQSLAPPTEEMNTLPGVSPFGVMPKNPITCSSLVTGDGSVLSLNTKAAGRSDDMGAVIVIVVYGLLHSGGGLHAPQLPVTARVKSSDVIESSSPPTRRTSV